MKSQIIRCFAGVVAPMVIVMAVADLNRSNAFGPGCFNSSRTAYAYPYPYSSAYAPYAADPVGWGANTSGYGTYPYNAYTGYPNTSYSPLLPAGLPQTQYALLPTGGYASNYYRAPTTYYRPVTVFDPNVGTTVTSLQPCASYQYQAQRAPLLVPGWSNYAYGGYAASNLQNRWSPITAPSVGSAAGQSSLSIASGFGTYGTSPVVQLPLSSPVFQPSPPIPMGSPITSGYGVTNTYIPIVQPVTPIGPTVTSPYSTSNTLSGTVATPTYQYGSTPTYQYGSTPTYQYGSTPTYQYGSAPTWTSNPPVGANASILSNTSVGPMPGSMGQAIMPPAVSTHVSPNTSPAWGTSNPTVLPPVMPTNPTLLPQSSSLPSGMNMRDGESTVVPTNQPNVAENYRSEPNTTDDRPRFQLRSVERGPTMNATNNPNPVPNPVPPSTSNQGDNGSINNPVNNNSNPEGNLELKLNMESLRPIPPPQDFDASPEWKPALLNVRDQTARTDSQPRSVELPAIGSRYHEVRFLNSTRESSSIPTTPSSVPIDSHRSPQGTVLNDGQVTATLRPIQKSAIPTESNSTWSTGGWTTAGPR